MSAVKQDLTVAIGTTFRLAVTVRDHDTKAPVDLPGLGYTGHLVVHGIASLSCPAVVSLGRLAFAVPDTDTALFKPGVGDYAVTVTDGTEVFRLAEGRIRSS